MFTKYITIFLKKLPSYSVNMILQRSPKIKSTCDNKVEFDSNGLEYIANSIKCQNSLNFRLFQVVENCLGTGHFALLAVKLKNFIVEIRSRINC